MPTSKEFTIKMEDRPGTLGKVCRALADRGVNILAFQSFPTGAESLVRFVVDNPTTAKTVLDTQRLTYTETEVAQVKLPHRPGELARAASRLGDASININYAYTGVEPGTNAPLLIFGVTEVSKAASILDQTAAAAAGT
ncbi:MAG: ACT domain-containing protein [Acidobacteria bacterium]|nr:ACT domain-containing protein [Acidobacteriota bacterium]